jgi:hypothetical protein
MSSDRPVTTTVSARARASRINGARSRGPRTAAGKARSAGNALKHGLCALKHVVLPDEDAVAFVALEKALLEELAPVGALQAVLARQIVSAAWRLARADRIEAEILIFRQRDDDLGLAVTRDGNSARAVPTVVRYRGAAHAELLRTLRTLRALQAEARAGSRAGAEPAPATARRRGRFLSGRRNEPEQPREISDLAGRSSEPRHDAPARAAPPAPGARRRCSGATSPGSVPRQGLAQG